jgi:uncharacterized protein YycO
MQMVLGSIPSGSTMNFSWTSTAYPAGQAAPEYSIGDFILCHRKGFVSYCIVFGQGIRFRGDQRPYAHWSHAALLVSDKGDLVEALTKGVKRNHIDEYKDSDYTLVRVNASAEDQEQILRYANKIIDDKYSFSTIISAGFRMVIGGTFYFGFSGHTICSGLIARAQERMGAYFDREPQVITPADLARYYEVKK